MDAVDAALEAVPVAGPDRSAADRVARRVLGLPQCAPRSSIFGAESAFTKSIALSATRCLVTYVLIPLAGPLLGLTGALGPVLGIVLSAVSVTAIVFATRRFFAADHKWRWYYASLGLGVIALLVWQTVIDVGDLVS